MWIGWLEFDVLLGDVRSLKQKRSVTRPLVAELQRKFSVSAAETGSHDLYRRAGIGVAVVSGDRQPRRRCPRQRRTSGSRTSGVRVAVRAPGPAPH
ncbi:hypothetical protein MRGA423_13165 [Mycobacterium tuberculosis RGTB423]|nr:hypothetical protein MRGA423_13165 [Mycobacterium tuberculosis RGTB423]